MSWTEEGMVLSARRHGESDAILDVLTRDHGRHAGVVRGGGGRRLAPLMQPGTQLSLTWRARLEDHLGHFSVEPLRARAGLLADPLALAGLGAVTSLLGYALPERESQHGLYEATLALIDLMETGADWPLAYLRWEMGLLDHLGFGLDLTCCAATGASSDLAYISPKTGRAVSVAGAGDWADRLLPLPPAMLRSDVSASPEIARALTVTGHFLQKRLAPASGDKPLPPARDRLLSRLARAPSSV
ncbi:DNA repair protein RecO [Palleronia caenipelagi]|uniref:DNA repair protein RecO n=1 Tax=Palleronia caenipelagi TaxID=2489174 RepID=A0A547Q7F3_9RHOB|nr:DNA repair protein RecO [Palleronia caenipelagi]TRD22315.1 DNA repair protein RecO [Palleronia caenipelagi]